MVKLKQEDVNIALNNLKKQNFSTTFSRLVKSIITVHLTRRYDDEIGRLLSAIESKNSFLKSLLESEEGREIAEHYLISETSAVMEDVLTPTSFRGYFIERTKLLHENYMIRKAMAKSEEAKLEEAKTWVNNPKVIWFLFYRTNGF
ncbi:MAG: hypothetical protein ACP5U0_10450 [Caldisphaera sp.]